METLLGQDLSGWNRMLWQVFAPFVLMVFAVIVIKRRRHGGSGTRFVADKRDTRFQRPTRGKDPSMEDLLTQIGKTIAEGSPPKS